MEINEASFSGWKKKILAVIKATERFLRSLLDEYLLEICFGVSHGSTWVRVHYVHPHNLYMRPQKFMLTTKAFQKKVSSWLGIAR